MYVEFGNDHAIEGYRDPNSDDPEAVRYRPAPGQRVTQVSIPEGLSLRDAFNTAIAAMEYHIAEGEKPAWVESDSEGLQALLAEHYGLGDKAVRSKSWGKDTGVASLPRVGSIEATMLSVLAFCLGMLARLPMFSLLQAFSIAKLASLQLRTDAGRDFQARVMGDTASNGTGSYAPGTYIGLTANSTAPAAGNTTLTGEIAAGTLARAVAVYAHTNGTATYTLTKTFTSDQTVVIAKIGVFNAAAAGTMVFETLLNATASLVSGDQLQVTETVTL